MIPIEFFSPVVIDGHLAIEEIVRQRYPTFQAVVDRPGGCRAIGYQLPLPDQPGM